MTITVDIPGGAPLHLDDLVLDVNGTLTNRGALIDGVPERLQALSDRLRLHVLSADTFGGAQDVADRLGATFTRVATGADKRGHLEKIGTAHCIAIGNGANDAAMLAAAAIGIAVIGPEGASGHALSAASMVVRSITDALDLLSSPQALTATLRP